MTVRKHCLAAALSALVLAGCAAEPAQQAADAAPAAAAAEPVDILTIDTHVDIPLDYMRDPRFDVGTDTPLQVDLGKMERGGLDAAFFVIYVGQGPLTPEGYAKAVAQAERKYSAIEMMLEKYPDRIRAATTPQQVRDNHAAGLLSAMIGIENSYSLGHDLARIDAAYARGARYLGLVHAGNNDLCTSSAPNVERGEPEWGSPGDTGMSDFGRQAVARANALGMMVDVSHASDNCMRDALEVSKAPIIASHSSARALVDHKRNIPDDILRAIGEKGGVVQAVAYKEFVKHDPARAAAERALQAEVAKLAGDAEYDDSKHDSLPAMAEGMARIQQEHPLATVQEYVDHIEHIARVAGIDHVGIAADFDGGGGVTGWMDATETGNVTAELRKRGFSDADIAKIWGGNLLRVWQQVIDVAAADSTATE
jgi:membrane dipeptidase